MDDGPHKGILSGFLPPNLPIRTPEIWLNDYKYEALLKIILTLVVGLNFKYSDWWIVWIPFRWTTTPYIYQRMDLVAWLKRQSKRLLKKQKVKQKIKSPSRFNEEKRKRKLKVLYEQPKLDKQTEHKDLKEMLRVEKRQ